MDLFAWNQLSSDYDRADSSIHQEDVALLWIPDTHNDSWRWADECATNYMSQLVPFPLASFQNHEQFPAPESSQESSYDGSHFDGSPRETSLDAEILSGDAKAVGRPRAPVVSGRDPNENRVQRRRTQNRNSQRVYRQRRIDERNTFEARAKAAEEDSEKLRSKVNILQSEVEELTEQVKDLEMENAALRGENVAGSTAN